jgi:copper chaperone
MSTSKFKTSINCGGCVATVTPILNALPGVDKWTVDINDPNKILEITSNSNQDTEVIQALSKIGYKAEKV